MGSHAIHLDRRSNHNPLAGARGHVFSASVDTAPPAGHGFGVDKKPPKVEEPQAPYLSKQPEKEKSAVRYATAAQTKQSMDKVFRVHKELLRKLAQ